MDIRVLGPLEIERDGEQLHLGGTKQRSVLAVLILHAGRAIDFDRLADALWDGKPPPSAESTLRSYISNLRKALEPERKTNEPPRTLRTTAAGYILDVPNDHIDARRFEQLVTDGRHTRSTGNVNGAADIWTQALALWRGRAFQDFTYSSFAQTEASRLTELRLSCLEDLYDARIELGQHDTVVGDLDALCAEHPHRERALGLRMLALYRCGRQTEALTIYEDGRRRLADELGVDPSPDLRTLHENIVRHEPSIAAPAPVRTSGKQTMTFLLGDIERSTEKLRTLGDDYTSVLEEHRETLQEAFEAHNGRAVRIYGDATFAAFDSATDAVDAAVAAQLALALHGEPALPVRMGLHTGEATFSGGEFVGMAIHVAARITDAAHGGQILISRATKELLGTKAGDNVEMFDVGLHQLKDIPEPARLFQPLHPKLRRDFPPIRTRWGQTDNLPHRLTSFVGREHDLEQIEATIVDGRVLTLTGVGGVGKTRLAVEVGQRLLPRYSDGVWFCELASIGNAESLIHSLATTLGIEQQPGRSLRKSVLGALRQRSSLLILDNCEHLLVPVARLVEDIVHTSTDTDILATSREALGVEGEHSRPVPSLEVEPDDPETEAVCLFSDRARAARPEFTVDDHNASHIADICAKLDGIPLAIELAAARVTSLSPAQIAKRLEEGFDFLRSGRRAAVDRHRTLHGAIDWSYELLSESEKLLFDRLSVFAGGFTLEAAEEVCGRGLDLDVADGLASLVAKSLVDADVSGEEARYSLLETMRQYAQDRLSERDDAVDVLRAHATYFVMMLEGLGDLFRVDSERAMSRVPAELDNLRSAQAWAMSSGDVDLAIRIAESRCFVFSWEFPELFRWAEEAIALPGTEDHQLLPTVLARAAGSSWRVGDLVRCRELLVRALGLVDDPDDPRRLEPLGLLRLVEASEGRLDEARRWYAEQRRVARANGDAFDFERIVTLSVESMVESNAGDHAAAVELAEAGYALSRTSSSGIQGLALYYLGEALLAAGQNLDRALECLDRSIELCRANEMQFWVGTALVAKASLRARHGDPVEALPMFGHIIDRWRRTGDWTRQWVTLRNLTELLGRIGANDAAATLDASAEASGTAEPSIGPQGDRLAGLRHALSERMGEKPFAAACERGRAMSDEDAVSYAKSEIARALDAHPAKG